MQRSVDGGEDIHSPTPDLELRLLKVSTPEDVIKLLELYESMPFAKPSKDLFRADLLSPNSWFVEVGDVGLVYLTYVVPRFIATFNVLFWDRKISKDRKEIIRDILAQAFDRFDLVRIAAFVPSTNEPLVSALRKIGFTIEGRLRKAFMQEAEFSDVVVLGLLKDEVTWPSKATIL